MRNGLALWKVVRGIAAACAFLLLFAPLGGRTTWTEGSSTSRDGPGYDGIVLLAGIVALIALVVGRRDGTGAPGRPVGTLIALAAFGVATGAAGFSALALARDGFPFGRARLLPGGVIVTAAAGPPVFAAVAATGLACCAVLAVIRVRTGSEGRLPA